MASKSEEEYEKRCRLHLGNLPPSTKEELREFLTGVQVKEIHPLGDKNNEAIVELISGSQVGDAVSKCNGKQLKDNVINAKAIISHQLICVAHLPLSYTDGQFKELCQKVGPVRYAYLIRTKAGQSKGYGMVEFEGDLEKTETAQVKLDEMKVDEQCLHAEIVKESVQESYQAMQSQCLLVSGLPDSFNEIMLLRETFSCVNSPIYSQILVKEDKPLGYGLVEFKTAEEAEATWHKLKDLEIKGNKVNISFCIPGHPASAINNKIVWAGVEESNKPSLLPDPVKNVSPIVKSHNLYINLGKFIPNFDEEFTDILAELQKSFLSQKLAPVDRPGLLGPAPSLPMSPIMSPNIQIGLATFYAMMIQKTKGEPFVGKLTRLNSLCDLDSGLLMGSKASILGDPVSGQANVLFSSLKQQLDEKSDLEEGASPEPLRTEEKLKENYQRFVKNAHGLNTTYLSNFGEVVGTLYQMLPRQSGNGLLDTPAPCLGSKSSSLLGPVPGQGLNPLMGNNFCNGNDLRKGLTLLGEALNIASGGKLPSLLRQRLPNRISRRQQMQDEQSLSNQAIVQAMGLGMGTSGMNNLSQTLLGQISKGLVNQIGQNLRYQKSVNDFSGGGKGPGMGLLGEMPPPGPGPKKSGGRSSLLGERPMKNSPGGQTFQDQGSWKGTDDKWGSSFGYESGYNNKSGAGNMGEYEFSGGYGNSFDMNNGYMGGYSGGSGVGDADYYYNNNQYQSSYGSGGNDGDYGMGSSGLSGNQASGVNFQDGSGNFGKGMNASGHGPDNGSFENMDGFGGNGGMGGYSSYGSYGMMGKGGMGDKGYYDSYITSGNGDYAEYGDSSMGMGNNMGSGMGNNAGSGFGNNMGSGMGNTGNGFGNSMGNNPGSGFGNNMGSGMGNIAGSGFGNNMGSGMGGNMGNNMSGNMGGISLGYGKDGPNQSSYFSGGIDNSYNGSNMGGGSLLGSGEGMMDNYMGGTDANNMGNSLLGEGFVSSPGNKFGGRRDQGNAGGSWHGGASAYSGSGGGLLPPPGENQGMNMPGQKRGYNQMLPKKENDSKYTSHQMGGQFDSYKRSRMY